MQSYSLKSKLLLIERDSVQLEYRSSSVEPAAHDALQNWLALGEAAKLKFIILKLKRARKCTELLAFLATTYNLNG